MRPTMIAHLSKLACSYLQIYGLSSSVDVVGHSNVHAVQIIVLANFAA